MKTTTLKNTKVGEYVRRKADSKITYIRRPYDRITKRIPLIDCEDVCRNVYLSPNTEVFTGFTY